MIKRATEPYSNPGDGLTLAQHYFARVLSTGRLSHAYLFWGDEGSGKHTFASNLAKSIHCTSGTPCNECSSCHAIDHGNHSSVHVFGPVEGKQLIDIETARTLCERLQYKSEQTQIAILENADLLNEPAANALLKTLEEPPGNSVLILTARSTGALLPTLVSRCHRVPFRASAHLGGAADPKTDEVVRSLRSGELSAASDPKGRLAELFPDAGTDRDTVRQALGVTIESEHLPWRPEAAVGGDCFTGRDVDAAVARVEALLELLAALDGNVHPDLVLEQLLATYSIDR